jgi:exonuclease V
MVYKELLDAMLTADVEEERRASERSSDGEESIVLPSAIGFTFAQVFRHLSLNPLAPFSDSFMAQSKPVVVGNTLRWGAGEARCLDDMVAVWSRYVGALGLGSPSAAQPRASQATNDCKGRAMDLDPGRSESRLELVYRRAGAKDTKKSFETAQGRRKKRRKRADDGHGSEAGADCTTKAVEDDDRLLKVAISESLQDFATEDQLESDDPSQAARLEPQRIKYSIERASEEERQEDELASAVEMSIVGPDPGAVDEIEVVLPLSRQSQGRPEQDKPILAPGPGHRSYVDGKRSTLPSTSPTPSPDKSMASGTIIGRHRFQHNPVLLEAHLNSVLQFWMGEREPEGVKLEQTNRCGWCEFEEGCEWRWAVCSTVSDDADVCRAQKAKETWDRVKKERDSSNVKLRRGSNLHREA